MKVYAPFILVFIFICFDFLTGWIKALTTATLDSSIMRKGLYRKIGEILAVLFGILCDYGFVYINIEMPVSIAVAIATYIILMESASIIENICVISPPLSKGLRKIFADNKILLHEDNKDGNKDESANSD